MKVDVPSGLANTWVYSLRPAATSTLPPQAFAAALADRSSGRSVTHGTGAADAGVAAAPPATSTPAKTVNATEPFGQTVRLNLDMTTVNPPFPLDQISRSVGHEIVRRQYPVTNAIFQPRYRRIVCGSGRFSTEVDHGY
ncbi:hypothetical protein [Dactylosporangium sp. NPDC000521]|uniref:hypothetical protein n=1 Tax=Dactylosporangium sp. NPDC000521 TaxID=3363975 RepID=UPI003680877C